MVEVAVVVAVRILHLRRQVVRIGVVTIPIGVRHLIGAVVVAMIPVVGILVVGILAVDLITVMIIN